MDIEQLTQIATEVIAPVIVMVAVGYLIGRLRVVEPEPIAAVYMTVFTPALAFMGWLNANLSGDMLARVFLFSALAAAVMHALSYGVSRAMGHDRGMRGAFINANIMYNSANYGLPVQAMAFKGLGEVVQPLVLMIQSLIAFTVGSFNAASNSPSLRATLKQVLQMPVIWATILGGIVHSTGYTGTMLKRDLPMVWAPLNYFQMALVPVALLSLGVQLSRVRIHGKALNIAVACFLRLVTGPLIGLGIGYLLLGLRGEMLAILVVSVSFPTAVFSSVVATSFKNHEDFAAAQVFISTVISIVTVTLVIYLSKVYLVPTV